MNGIREVGSSASQQAFRSLWSYKRILPGREAEIMR
jgi:hypothetical protein